MTLFMHVQRGTCCFMGAYETIQPCHKCGLSRFKMVGESLIPQKILSHFPFIIQLTRMFNILKQTSLMNWHLDNRSVYELVWHVANSKQWKFIDEKWPNFAQEPCNIL